MNDITIIGIDGGASKVNAHVIEYDGSSFTLSDINSTKSYIDYRIICRACVIDISNISHFVIYYSQIILNIINVIVD